MIGMIDVYLLQCIPSNSCCNCTSPLQASTAVICLKMFVNIEKTLDPWITANNPTIKSLTLTLVWMKATESFRTLYSRSRGAWMATDGMVWIACVVNWLKLLSNAWNCDELDLYSYYFIEEVVNCLQRTTKKTDILSFFRCTPEEEHLNMTFH